MAAEEGSERELAEFLDGTGVFSQEEPEEPGETGEAVYDEPPGFAPPEETAPPSPGEPAEQPTEEQETEEQEEEGEPHVVWARKKYGTDPDKWAKAAFDQERFISQLATEKKQAETIAQQAIEYAQEVEAQTQARTSMSMPLSASEEAWVEQSATNPAAYAYQAARSGNAQLYNAVLENVSLDNPVMAGQIAAQVNIALQNEARELEARSAQNGAAQQPPDFNTDMGQSIQELGIDLQKYGEAMSLKFGELGEYHPYTLAVFGGDPIQRNLALQAVYDLVRAGATTARRIGDETREEQIRREGELRRGAASVVTGSPHVPPQKESPLMEGMMEEWRRRGQWHDEE